MNPHMIDAIILGIGIIMAMITVGSLLAHRRPQ